MLYRRVLLSQGLRVLKGNPNLKVVVVVVVVVVWAVWQEIFLVVERRKRATRLCEYVRYLLVDC